MDFLDEAWKLFDFTSGLRRDLHQHPEVSFELPRTSKIVADSLRSFGYRVTEGIGRSGVVGLLESQNPGSVLMLRFDMDALPMQEENDVSYASLNPGKMHACGHDAHTAIGITVAKLLAEHKDELFGTLKFVFQPAEEGDGGAEAMIADGVLSNPIPDYVLGIHLWNDKEIGWVGISDGPVMSRSDVFSVSVQGKGGHGAVPQNTIDPILASAHIITALQSIISRNVPPLESGVVSVTRIHGGTAFNIIPEKVIFVGTLRSFTPKVYDLIIQKFTSLIQNIAKAFNCKAEISYNEITLPVINDPNLSEKFRKIVKEMDFFKEIDSQFRTMGSEDFSFFVDKIPGCYILIGSANQEKGLVFGHHNPKFDIDETCLPQAVALLCQGSLDLLRKDTQN